MKSLTNKIIKRSSKETSGKLPRNNYLKSHPSLSINGNGLERYSKTPHRIAVIMVTDIVGYSNMICEDEEKTLDMLAKNTRIQRFLIEKYCGTWIKEMGDGILSCFDSASMAVDCALEIQECVHKVLGIQLYIGIHLSKVVFIREDVFGLGVNIAFRIQELALPGKIWASESIANNTSDQKNFHWKLIGKQKLKHINVPLRIYEIDGIHSPEEPNSLFHKK